MLPEAGAFELIFLAAVALIVVGPKDLPLLLRKIGQFLARMRGMAAEFRASFDELARQSELDELRREVEALRNSRFGEPIAADLNASLSEFHDTVRSATDSFTPSPPSVYPGVVPQEGPVVHEPLSSGDVAEVTLPAEGDVPVEVPSDSLMPSAGGEVGAKA
jgi:sec-independent protein translocase protein TatB